MGYSKTIVDNCTFFTFTAQVFMTNTLGNFQLIYQDDVRVPTILNLSFYFIQSKQPGSIFGCVFAIIS